MLELALFLALVGSVCFLTYEFYKINSVYQERMHYYRFLPGFSMADVSKDLDMHTINSDFKSKMTHIDSKLLDVQSRMDRQEAVIEKLIKGIGD